MCICVLTLTSLVDSVLTRSRRALVLAFRAGRDGGGCVTEVPQRPAWSWPRAATLCVVPATGLSARPARAAMVPEAPSCFLVAHKPLYFVSSAVLSLNSSAGESRCSSRNLSVKAWGNLQTKQPLGFLLLPLKNGSAFWRQVGIVLLSLGVLLSKDCAFIFHNLDC